MKRILIIFLMTALSLGTRAQDSLTISLLTCSQGSDISSAFGHSALRVKDIKHGRDMVFNYGTFSFNEPHFMLNFLRGDLNYFLSVSSFTQFKKSYDRAGRGITEQQLNITPRQAAWLYGFLLENYQPSNRYYLYDFLQDNCATRIRDIFDDSPDFIIIDSLSGMTYREELTRLVGDRRWMMFGIDLILGARIDRTITVRETEARWSLPAIPSQNLRPDRADGRISYPRPQALLPYLHYCLYFTLLSTCAVPTSGNS